MTQPGMFRITLTGKMQADGSEPTAEVYVPALPRIGDHVSHDLVEGLSGYVRNVDFWWDEEDVLTISVRLK
jgi:hypothetical protein